MVVYFHMVMSLCLLASELRVWKTVLDVKIPLTLIQRWSISHPPSSDLPSHISFNPAQVNTVSGLMHFTLQGFHRPKWHQEGKKINKYFSDGRMECILLNSEQPFFLLLLIKNDVLVCKHSNIHNIGHRCRRESGVRWCFKLVLKLR